MDRIIKMVSLQSIYSPSQQPIHNAKRHAWPDHLRRIVHTTDEHPFLVAEGEELRWVEAGQLIIGDMVVSADGTIGLVEAVEIILEAQTMYNLTVALSATYVVGTGQWVVHNVECPVGWSKGLPYKPAPSGIYMFDDANYGKLYVGKAGSGDIRTSLSDHARNDKKKRPNKHWLADPKKAVWLKVSYQYT